MFSGVIKTIRATLEAADRRNELRFVPSIISPRASGVGNLEVATDNDITTDWRLVRFGAYELKKVSGLYYSVDWLMDEITWDARALVTVGGSRSVAERMKDADFRDSVGYGRLPFYEVKERIWRSGGVATNYRTSVAYAIYKHFAAKNVLDPSSGWGDRLFAAHLAEVESYHGYDVNAAVFPIYDLVNREVGPSKTKVEMFRLPFERMDHAIPIYDLVYTSPPFFDYEKYGSDDGQATFNSGNYDSWVRTFYQPYLENCAKSVKSGGHVVIYATDVRNAPLTMTTLRILQSMEGLSYQYFLYYKGTVKKVRPHWVFLKA